jgi:hypothetical protein
MSEEIWKPVVDFPDYEVSNLGRVKSLGMIRRFGKGKWREYREKILAPWMARGYPTVYLSGGAKKQVHRLVADAFLTHVDGKEHVNHINGKKTDNRPENLEFVTPKENIIHARRVLKIGIGETHGHAKLTDAQVKEIISSPLRPFELMGQYGVSHETIRQIKLRHTWRHL